MKTGDRLEKIQQLKSLDAYDRGVICNAKCLAEGVDVPSLDGIAFIDPKGSQIEIIQAVGRAIRKVRGAKLQAKGTIVIPVFIEEGDNVEASIEASDFKPVWDVLNALRAHDETLAETLDQYRAALAQSTSNSNAQIDKVIFDLPVSVGLDFASALRTLVVECTTASWEFWFTKLQLYKQERGDCLVPVKFKNNEGYRLGSWVNVQRTRRSSLSSSRVQRLDALGFVWDVLDHQWEEGIRHLRRYEEEHGNCLVNRTYKSECGYKLGRWVGKQRNRKSQLSSDRVWQLDAIGFVWDVLDHQWEEGISHLKKYYQAYGNCLVTRGHMGR